jgi:hypothetical protein
MPTVSSTQPLAAMYDAPELFTHTPAVLLHIKYDGNRKKVTKDIGVSLTRSKICKAVLTLVYFGQPFGYRD